MGTPQDVAVHEVPELNDGLSAPAKQERPTFEKELEILINRHCVENASNTPDFILAQYMKACLLAFETATQQRETWHGRDPRPLHTRYGVDLGASNANSSIA